MGGDRFDDWDDGHTAPVSIDDVTVDDRPAGRPSRKPRRTGRGLPTSLAALLIVGAVALGATTVPIVLTAATAPASCQDEQGNPIDCPTDPPGQGTTPTPTPTPTATPTDGAGGGSGGGGGSTGGGDADKPKDPPPTDNPDPKPTHHRPDPLGLRLSNVEGGVKVDWTACGADRFDLYKIVRSTDPRVRWPLGAHDRLVGVVRERGTTMFIDRHAPAGKKVWYRVFCIDKTAHGYRVLNSTPAKAIRTQAEKPAPTPGTLGLEAKLTDGGVALDWTACQADAFHWYKVVRSHGENPSYVPRTDGSQLISIIENRSKTEYTDTHVESGQTWFYRVQCVGFKNGNKVVLGQTAAIKVTIP